jgi:hypothetical protein
LRDETQHIIWLLNGEIILEEEKTLSQEDNMRSKSESDETKEKRDNAENNVENNEKDQPLSEEPEKSSETDEDTDEDYEETAKSNLLPKYGCLKGCLIPIIGVFVIIIAIGMLIYSKSDRIHEWLILRIVSNTQEKVFTQPPDGIDKKTIELTFDNVKSAFRNGKIDEQEMENAIKEYLGATADTTLPERKKAEIDKLILRLNKAISDSG